MVCIIIFEVKNSALTKILLIINVHTSILWMQKQIFGIISKNAKLFLPRNSVIEC